MRRVRSHGGFSHKGKHRWQLRPAGFVVWMSCMFTLCVCQPSRTQTNISTVHPVIFHLNICLSPSLILSLCCFLPFLSTFCPLWHTHIYTAKPQEQLQYLAVPWAAAGCHNEQSLHKETSEDKQKTAQLDLGNVSVFRHTNIPIQKVMFTSAGQITWYKPRTVNLDPSQVLMVDRQGSRLLGLNHFTCFSCFICNVHL